MGMDDTTHTRGKGAGVKKEEAQTKTLTTTTKTMSHKTIIAIFPFFRFHQPFNSIDTPSLVKKSEMGFGKKKT